MTVPASRQKATAYNMKRLPKWAQTEAVFQLFVFQPAGRQRQVWFHIQLDVINLVPLIIGMHIINFYLFLFQRGFHRMYLQKIIYFLETPMQ